MRTIVKEYRQVIANLEVNQKELKTKANKSCAQDGAAQSQLILTTTDSQAFSDFIKSLSSRIT